MLRLPLNSYIPKLELIDGNIAVNSSTASELTATCCTFIRLQNESVMEDLPFDL